MTEMRKTALQVILGALLAHAPNPVPAAEDDGGWPELLRTSEAARLLGSSEGSLYNWERKGPADDLPHSHGAAAVLKVAT